MFEGGVVGFANQLKENVEKKMKWMSIIIESCCVFVGPALLVH